MKTNLLFLLAFLMTVSMTEPLTAQTLEQQMDKKISESYPADGPGVAVLVAKGGKVIYRKGFGKANLEMDTPMKPEYVFRIGSITKQFTSVAILKLAEEGKLSISDPLTKFIPDYPTHGKTITVEHLLNHTSGIKSYTGMDQWTDEVRRRDFTVDSLINYFKNEPMDFAPGEKWEYNNSGYILLGFIIEKVSGMSYADYVEQNFFKPLGMKNSYYGYTDKIIPNRLPGYQKQGDNYENANFLSMTQPYAAGSLLSTVDDLYTWYKAVAAGKVISAESLKKAITPTKTTDGKTIEYGYGLGTGVVQGSASYGHNGGINGFLSSSVYLPKEDIFAVTLTNCTCSPLGDLDAELAAIALGKPYEWKEVAVDAAKLPEYQAVYQTRDGATSRTIRFEDGKLTSQVSGSRKYDLMPVGKDKFHVNNSLTDLQFNRNDKGAIVSVTSTSRNEPIVWEKTDVEVAMREAIEVPVAVLNQYPGNYELFPNFIIVVRVENGQLTAEPTGQAKVVLHPESQTKFFIKEVDAQIEFFKNDKGEVENLKLYQGGQTMVGKKK
jgi:CubicO group peptidase (beta-lactamase class C family)